MGESHRIYWQQWLSAPLLSSTSSSLSSSMTSPPPQQDGRVHHHSHDNNNNAHASSSSSHERSVVVNKKKQQQQQQPQLITSSAAVRIAPGNAAQAKDVTKLLRDTLNLTRTDNNIHHRSSETGSDSIVLASPSTGYIPRHDSLVLVGTLYSLPKDYVVFEHEVGYRMDVSSSSSSSPSSSSEPFHVVKTLQGKDHPLQVRDRMVQHLDKVWQKATKNRCADNYLAPSSSSSSVHTPTNNNKTPPPPPSTTIPPPIMKTQWYFVPGAGSGGPSVIPSCIELDGYATDMDTDDDEDDDVHDETDRFRNRRNNKNDGSSSGGRVTCESDSEDDDELKEDLSTPVTSTPSPSKTTQTRGMTFIMHSPLKGDYGGFPSFASSHSSTSYWISDSLNDTVPNQLDKTANGKNDTEDNGNRPYYCHRDLRQYLEVSQSYSTNPNTLTGYLLKQSRNDPYVWKRVYCILTEDYLWYIHRCCGYNNSSVNDNNNGVVTYSSRLASKRRKIRLSKALLLEPSTDDISNTSPQSMMNRIPHSFSVMNGKGFVHVFRASSRRLAYHWTQAISVRLVEAMETSSLLQSAELIVTDETVARTGRWKALAIEPFLIQSKQPTVLNSNHGDGDSKVGLLSPPSGRQELTKPSVTPFATQVLRLGMAVAQYREGCRHIQSLLWSQVGSMSNPGLGDREIGSIGRGTKREGTMNNNSITSEGFGSSAAKTCRLVQEAWREASDILVEATQVAMQVQISGRPVSPESNNNSSVGNINTGTKQHVSRSLETLCRHIDYIITGQLHHRSLASVSSSVAGAGNGIRAAGGSRHTHHHRDPPPMDLFDSLIAELQSIAREQIMDR